MIICENCFEDQEIRAIIRNNNRYGTCSVCGSSDVCIYDTDVDFELSGILDNLINVYTPENSLPNNYPTDDRQLLCDILKNDWEIFSEKLMSDDILKIIKALSPTLVSELPDLFSKKVGIGEKYDEDYLEEHSILKTQGWDIFVDNIKHKNRFHNNLINTKMLQNYCNSISEKLPVNDSKYYRGRIAKNPDGYPIEKMGAPDCEHATDGRANSMGISRLYLSDDFETIFHEIRAAEYDYVCVAEFKQIAPIEIVDLQKIAGISPVFAEDDGFCTELAINREHLKKINNEMGKTMRKNDSPLDYVPTQYICDFVMSIIDDNGNPKYDGVRYRSAMHNKGNNLTIFYPEKFECLSCKTYEVKEINYNKEPV